MHLITQLNRFPGLLRFLSTDTLARLLAQRATPRLRARMMAESIHRAWQFGGGNNDSWMPGVFSQAWRNAGIPEKVIADLKTWAAKQAVERDWTPPASWAEWTCSDWHQELTLLLETWRLADGLIPVIVERPEAHLAEAVALPFRLLDRTSTHDRRVHGRGGRSCDVNFDEALASAEQLAKAFKWADKGETMAIELSNLDGNCGVAVSGGSAGLPVLLARAFRHDNIHVPCFVLAASGNLNPATLGLDLLENERIAAKKERLFQGLGVNHVILPGGCAPRWSCDTNLAERVAQLVADLREKPGVEPDAHDRLLQTVKMHASVMHNGFTDAQKVEGVMMKLLNTDLPLNLPRLKSVRAEALITLSAARNHLGKTEAAQESVREALSLMEDLPAAHRGHAWVRQAVILQDMGDYEDGLNSCNQARSVIDDILDTQAALELKTKTYGTEGQVLTCLALESGDRTGAGEALHMLKQARECAIELDRIAKKPDAMEEPRNAAYLFWWHALHAPDQAGKIWDEVWSLAQRDLTDATSDFLRRHRWLAVYRSLLTAGRVPTWFKPDESMELPDQAEWLTGTSLKYRATWHASEGRADEAMHDFDQSIVTMTGPKCPPLIQFFAATSALQACTSLAAFDAGIKSGYEEQASRLFRQVAETSRLFPSRRFNSTAWTDFLEDNKPGYSASNPQIFFPY